MSADRGSTPEAPRRFETPFPNEPLLCDTLTVSEQWIDYNNHMNVGYYLLVFDQALDRIYDNWLDLGANYVRAAAMGPFALQSSMHYLKELRLGERFEVRFQLLDHDAKRWHYFLSMIRCEDGAVAATAEQLSMNVDHAARRSAPLPEAQARRLEALMAAHRDLPRPAQVGQPIGIRRSG